MVFFDLQQKFYGAYSGYTWHAKPQQRFLATYDPSTEQRIAKVAMPDVDDLERVVQEAQQAFQQWSLVPAPVRGQVVKAIGDLLRLHQSALADLIVLEMGKPKREAMGEVQEMIDMADYAVGLSRMIFGKTMQSERPMHRLYEQWHPYGVVGILTSFNFPMAVWSWNAFIALVCGNVVIWKPSSKTPLCAIAVHELCMDVMKKHQLPAIASLFISDAHQLTQKLIQDRRLPLISFTGSTQIGREVAQWVGGRLGRCILELGGNNALIIDESADLDLSLRALVFGALGTAGQRCTTTRRVFIHQTHYAAIRAKLLDIYAQISVGPPQFEQHFMGPLVDTAAVDRYEEAIKEIKAAGGEILYGGYRMPQKGYFVAPTLVQGLDFQHPVVQRETFAPILYLFAFDDFQQVVMAQNQVSQGLSSALFTNQLQHMEYFLSVQGSDCGMANINVGTSGAEITGAFGGEKDSGGGREAGSDAWKAYMRRQTNTINWGKDLPLAQGICFDAF